MSDDSLQKVLERALKALCLTRDYVGAETLPAEAGWDWYDAGTEVAAVIPNSEWAEQFRLRIEGE